MLAMLPERMSAVDAAWRRMDDSKQHATIVTLLVFEGVVERAALAHTVGRAIEKHERFRARVHDRGLLGATWELDPEFDIDRHVKAAHRPRDLRALRELVSDIASEPFDPAHPLWEMVVTEHPGGGTAVISKVHHCVGDGVALVRVLLGMTDEGSAIAPPEVGWRPETPEVLEEKLTHLASEADTLAKTLLLPMDPPSVLRGSISPRKVVAWSGPIELERVRAIGKLVSGTINDALVAAIAGGSSVTRTIEAGRSSTTSARWSRSSSPAPTSTTRSATRSASSTRRSRASPIHASACERARRAWTRSSRRPRPPTRSRCSACSVGSRRWSSAWRCGSSPSRPRWS
jgi:diacylglycerol O-acyltransferase